MASGISYVVGDATAPVGSGPKIIAHVCNDVGGWGAGFVLALSARWPEPERAYYRWYEARATNDFELGAVQVVNVSRDVWVANIIGQHDIVSGPEGPPVRYEAIETGLTRVAEEATLGDASVHMPRIGCGLAGGEWSVVEGIIERTLIARSIPTTVYDLA